MSNALINLLLTLKEYYVSLIGKPDTINWLPYISTILATVVSIVTLRYSSKNTRYSISRSNDSKSYERYQRQLEEFYYPFLLLTKRNATMYAVFALDEKKAFRPREQGFSTLVSLIEGHTFDGNDKAILTEIINNDNRLNDLIMQNSRHIESASLRELLSIASVHYTLMNLAFERKLNGHAHNYESYSYPDNLAENIVAEINQIELKMKKLS